jgi:Na+/H+-dicarboxylate symporter
VGGTNIVDFIICCAKTLLLWLLLVLLLLLLLLLLHRFSCTRCQLQLNTAVQCTLNSSSSSNSAANCPG